MAIELQDNTKIVSTPISYLDNRTEEQKALAKEAELLQKLDSAIKELLEKRHLLFDLSLPDKELQSKIENTTGFKFSPTLLVTYNGKTYNSYNTLFKDLRGQGNKEFYWLYTVLPRDVPKSMSDNEFKKYLTESAQLESSLRKNNSDITNPVYLERFKIDIPATYNGRTIPLSKAIYYRDIDKKNAKFNNEVDNSLATLVSAPLLMYGAATAPLSLGVSLVGGEAVDGVTNYFTNSDWNVFASNQLGVNPLGEFARTVMPWTNPGYLLGAFQLKSIPKGYSIEYVKPKRSMTPVKGSSITQNTEVAPYALDPLWGKYETARAFAREHPEYVKTYTVGSYVKDASDPNLKIILSALDIYYKDLLHQLSKLNVTSDFSRMYPYYNPYNKRVIKFIEYPSDYPLAGRGWVGLVGNDDAIYIDKSFALKDPEFWPENLLIHEGGGHGLSEDLFLPGGYLRTDNNLATLKVLMNMGKGFYKAHPLEARDIRLTPLELRYAEKAIPLSKEYLKEIGCEIPLEEAARTGYDARIYLSLLNGNILGKELDAKINSLTLEEAMTLLDNTSGYGLNAILQVKKMSSTEQKEWLENFKKLMYYSIGSSAGIAAGLNNNKVDKKLKGGPILVNTWYTPKLLTLLNTGLNGMIKSTIGEQYGLFNNPTARRLVGADNRMYVGKPGELGPNGNEIGNVYLSSADNWVVPLIQDVKGKLQFIPWNLLYTKDNERRTDSQSFRMRTPEEALYFGEHYKEVLYNPMFYGEYSPIKKLYFK